MAEKKRAVAVAEEPEAVPESIVIDGLPVTAYKR